MFVGFIIFDQSWEVILAVLVFRYSSILCFSIVHKKLIESLPVAKILSPKTLNYVYYGSNEQWLLVFQYSVVTIAAYLNVLFDLDMRYQHVIAT